MSYAALEPGSKKPGAGTVPLFHALVIFSSP